MKTARITSCLTPSGSTLEPRNPRPRRTRSGAVLAARHVSGSRRQVATWAGEVTNQAPAAILGFEDGSIMACVPPDAPPWLVRNCLSNILGHERATDVAAYWLEAGAPGGWFHVPSEGEPAFLPQP